LRSGEIGDQRGHGLVLRVDPANGSGLHLQPNRLPVHHGAIGAAAPGLKA
jgi:hypothetical protein